MSGPGGTTRASTPAGGAVDAVYAQTGDWPQFRANPSLTGVASVPLPASLKLLWTYDAGGAVESSAAIVGGVAFVGSGSGEIHAVDLATGKARWKYRAVSGDLGIGESSPAVSGGTVYIGDLAGVLHAVDAATGKHHSPGGKLHSSVPPHQEDV